MEENIYHHLNNMREYILHDSILSYIDNPEYEYCFCIYANTKYTLYLAARLIESLGIRAKSIGRIQSVYSSCNIDCIDIADLFKDIRCIDNYNTGIITIFDNTTDDDDFYIAIMRNKRDDYNGSNIVVGINWKHFCK